MADIRLLRLRCYRPWLERLYRQYAGKLERY